MWSGPHPRRRASEYRDHPLAVGKRLLDEEVLDPAVLAAPQQDDVGVFDPAAGATDLLVVGDDRSGGLVVHDERQVGLVVAHAERARGDHRLDVVAEQPVLGVDPVAGLLLAAVGHGGDSLGAQERGDLVGVALGERVHDPGTCQVRERRRQPGEPFRRPRQLQHLEPQARPRQRSAVGPERLATRPELRDHVGDDPVIGGRGRSEHRDARRERVEHVPDPPVIGAEIVAPIGDAMRLVDH